MITLVQSIDIPACYDKLVDFILNFETEFVKWSPDHFECSMPDGIKEGARLHFREIVMGVDYNIDGHITQCEMKDDHFKFTFVNDSKTAVIIFEGKRTESGCTFKHTESFGMQTPLIGPIVNFLFFNVIYRKKANWKLIEDDMILDNQYLYDILVNNKYPE